MAKRNTKSAAPQATQTSGKKRKEERKHKTKHGKKQIKVSDIKTCKERYAFYNITRENTRGDIK